MAEGAAGDVGVGWRLAFLLGVVVNPDDFGASRLDEAIALRHLLTMTGGWEWDEEDYARGESARDPVRFLLDQVIVDAPGTRFAYNSAGVNLLGVALEEATGESLPDYADKVLFGPLGIPDSAWEPVVGSRVNGGSGGPATQTATEVNTSTSCPGATWWWSSPPTGSAPAVYRAGGTLFDPFAGSPLTSSSTM